MPRQRKWFEHHENFNSSAEPGGVELLFLGDSFTHGWQTAGRAVWGKYYAPRRAANFSIGGDRSQHVQIWPTPWNARCPTLLKNASQVRTGEADGSFKEFVH